MTVISTKVRDAYDPVDKESNMPREPEEMLEQVPFSSGYIPDPEDSRDYKISSIFKSYTTTESVDYSNEMSPVKNQGSKGSCVGFAVSAVLEWQQQQEYLKEKEAGSYYTRDKKHYNLSEQWIYHKAKEVDEFPDDTSGTTIRAAMKVVNKQGVPPEHGWEYSDNSVGKPEFWAGSIAKWNKNKYYYRISNVDEMKKVLDTIGPFVMGVYVFIEMYYPENGYVAYPSNPNNCYGGHAIAIVGYDDNRKVFKFKNSWGTGWGDNGYGYLPYSYVRYFSIISWATIDEDVKEL